MELSDRVVVVLSHPRAATNHQNNARDVVQVSHVQIMAIAEAIQQGYSLQNINVISLGTGKFEVESEKMNEMAMQPEYDKDLFWK